jgi:hypothetical protein
MYPCPYDYFLLRADADELELTARTMPEAIVAYDPRDVLEHVCYRFRGGGDLHWYAFERVAIDPVGESGLREAHDTNGRPVEGRACEPSCRVQARPSVGFTGRAYEVGIASGSWRRRVTR